MFRDDITMRLGKRDEREDSEYCDRHPTAGALGVISTPRIASWVSAALSWTRMRPRTRVVRIELPIPSPSEFENFDRFVRIVLAKGKPAHDAKPKVKRQSGK